MAFQFYKHNWIKVPRPADRRCTGGALRAVSDGYKPFQKAPEASMMLRLSEQLPSNQGRGEVMDLRLSGKVAFVASRLWSAKVGVGGGLRQ